MSLHPGRTTHAAYSSVLLSLRGRGSMVPSGEYFHGPFETTDKDLPMVLLMSEGGTRALKWIPHLPGKVVPKIILLILQGIECRKGTSTEIAEFLILSS